MDKKNQKNCTRPLYLSPEEYGEGITAADMAMQFLSFSAEYGTGSDAEKRSHKDADTTGDYPRTNSGTFSIALELSKGTDPIPTLTVGSWYDLTCWIGTTTDRGSPLMDVTIPFSSLSLNEVKAESVTGFILE